MDETEAARYREVADAAAALLRANNSPRVLRWSMTMHLKLLQTSERRLSTALAAVGYRPAQRPVMYGSTPKWPKVIK